VWSVCRTVNKFFDLGSGACGSRDEEQRRSRSKVTRYFNLPNLRHNAPMKLNPSTNRNASLEKASRLLLAFDEDTPELGVMDLARRVGLNKSTASRFVATLTQLGLLERTEQGRKVRLSLRLFELGMRAARHRPLLAESRPILMRVAERVRDHTYLAVLLDGEVVFVQRAGGERLGAPFEIGQRYPGSRGAVGTVLHRARAHPVESNGRRRPASGEVAAADHGELSGGVSCVATGVIDRSGEVVAALVVAGASTRITPSAVPGIAQVLRQHATELSRRLGYYYSLDYDLVRDELLQTSRSA
jgi:DNA-binding IclR family transcriptional regulator